MCNKRVPKWGYSLKCAIPLSCCYSFKASVCDSHSKNIAGTDCARHSTALNIKQNVPSAVCVLSRRGLPFGSNDYFIWTRLKNRLRRTDRARVEISWHAQHVADTRSQLSCQSPVSCFNSDYHQRKTALNCW